MFVKHPQSCEVNKLMSDEDLSNLPAQRPYALVMFRQRHKEDSSTTLAEQLGNQIERRWLARVWLDRARLQEMQQAKGK
jgi:hypothetical protein